MLIKYFFISRILLTTVLNSVQTILSTKIFENTLISSGDLAA